jgi:hypothetical protein
MLIIELYDCQVVAEMGMFILEATLEKDVAWESFVSKISRSFSWWRGNLLT